MFLSRLIKTGIKSNPLNTAASASKSLLNPFLKIQIKHVSRSLISRENREKYDLKKMDDHWEKIEQDFNRRKEIAKQIEEKYKTNTENLISTTTKKSTDEVKEIYFVPLTASDESILEHFFKAEVRDDIRKGGRLVLLDEVRKYNKAHPLGMIDLDYEPLDAQDFEKLKNTFNYVLTEKEFFIVALQQGKKIFEFLEAFKKHKTDLVRNMNTAFRRLEHLDATACNHPLRNELNVSLRKVDNAPWIKSLFAYNKIDEKVLCEKFNKMYFEYLDCLNSAAAESRGFDIELFEDGDAHAEALESAKQEIEEKLEKISDFLDSIDFVDGKIVAASEDENTFVDAFRNGVEVENQNEYEIENQIENQIHSEEAAEGEVENQSEEAVQNNENVQNQNVEEDKNGVESENQSDEVAQGENEMEGKEVAQGEIEMEGEEVDEAELNEEIRQQYDFDPEKDYDNVFEKEEKDLTYEEYEYIRYLNDIRAQEEYATLNGSHSGRLLMKLIKAEKELITAASKLEELENNQSPFVYAAENLIKFEEIDEIIDELLQQNTYSDDEEYTTKKFNLQQKVDIEKEENLLKVADKPLAYLQNLYFDLVKSAVNDKEMKIPETVEDKETYVFRVLLKYFADVVQSKEYAFSDPEARLQYFGEKLKSYELYDNANNEDSTDTQGAAADPDISNPENLFTPNFKKLLDHLNKEHRLIEKSSYDYIFNVESKEYKYPLNVIDLSDTLPIVDGLGKEVLRFYLQNSDESNLLSEEDEEKVCDYVSAYLAEMKEILQDEVEDELEGIK